MKYDVIVIGAGLGGLTAGAKLAREGKKVLVIEQHSQPGGCATTFKRGDFTLEVGLHEMDGPSPRDMKSRIFSELEVTGAIEFITIPEFYHFVSDQIRLTIPHDPSQAKTILKDKFPDESDGIDAFFSRILSPTKKTAEYDQSEDISLGEFLDSIIKDENLKLVLLGNLGYFHDDPYSISLAYYSVAQGSYYSGGASYIKGGSQKLSDHLAEFINSHNGLVLLNHKVSGFCIENNKLSGLEYHRKRSSSKVILTAFADEIIANASMLNVASMLPQPYSKKLDEAIGSQKPGASLLTVYFGFKNGLTKLGHNHYSTFVFDSSIRKQSDIVRNNMGEYSSRSYTFIDYGQIDSDLAPRGKSVGAICCIDYLKDWEGLDEKQYSEKKEEVAKIFIARLEKLIPAISDAIEYYEVGTPGTIKRYTLNPEGAVYGFAQTPGKHVIATSGIFENLYFASAWGKTGGGFSGAIYSGYLCAYNILRKNKTKSQ